MASTMIAKLFLLGACIALASATFRCAPVNGDHDRRPKTRIATDNCKPDAEVLNTRAGDGEQFSCGVGYKFRSCPFWDTKCYVVEFILSKCPRPQNHPLYTDEHDPNMQDLDDTVGHGFNAGCGHHRRRNYTTGHDEGTYSITLIDCLNKIRFLNELIEPRSPTLAPTLPPTVPPTNGPSPAPRCVLPRTTSPLALEDVGTSVTDIAIGDSIKFICNSAHHELVGPETGRCIRSQGSAKIVPEQDRKCVQLSCQADALDDPDNGEIVKVDHTSGGDGITFKCDDGYTMNGNPVVTCAGTTWDGVAPTCTPKTCVDLTVLHGNVVVASKNFGAKPTIDCNIGYVYTGEQPVCALVSDSTDVAWSVIPTCEPITCDVPVSNSGSPSANQQGSIGYNRKVIFTCGDGLAFDGGAKKMTSMCVDGTIELPICWTLTCDRLNIHSPNISFASEKPTWSEGETMKVECELGYKARTKNNALEFTCTDGVWAPEPPLDCVQLALPRRSPSPANAALAVDGSAPFAVGESYMRYDCVAPWTGTLMYVLDIDVATNILHWTLSSHNDASDFVVVDSCTPPPTAYPTPLPFAKPTSLPTSTPTALPTTVEVPAGSSTNDASSSDIPGGAATVSVIAVVVVLMLVAVFVLVFVVLRKGTKHSDRESAAFDNPLYDDVKVYGQRPDANENNQGYLDIPANTNQAVKGNGDDSDAEEDV